MRTLFRNVYLSEVPIRSCSLAAGQLIADHMSPFWLGRYLAYGGTTTGPGNWTVRRTLHVVFVQGWRLVPFGVAQPP